MPAYQLQSYGEMRVGYRLFAGIAAYKKIGFDGPMRIDHMPTLYGESNANPGYATLGWLYAVGYLRGLMEMIER